MTNPVKLLKLLQYGVIAFPLAFAGLPVYLHAPDFYATSLNIPLEAIGFALLILRLFDAVQDPIIGDLSDKYWPYRSSIVIFGALLLVVGMWMIFHPNQRFPLAWLCLSVLICTSGFSIVSINVQALGGLWKVQPGDVTKIMASREAMGLCGLLLASIAPAILLSQLEPRDAFHNLTIGFIPLMLVCLALFYAWMKSVTLTKPAQEKSLRFFDIFSGVHTKLFFAGYLLSSFASSIPATLIIFYVRDYLQAESYLGLFLLIYFLSGASAMPLWVAIARRTSTLMSWCLSMVLALATFAWAFFLSPNDIIGYALVCFMSGIAVGANLSLPSAIAAEIIARRAHQQAASRYYSLTNFLSKLALALATGVALPLLGLSGYQPGQITTGPIMPIAYALVPCAIQVFAIIVLWRLMHLERRGG